jgi:hypothetical protein
VEDEAEPLDATRQPLDTSETAEDEPQAEADDDLEIPPEPKEWGVSVYNADLNNTDQDEGAKRDELV